MYCMNCGAELQSKDKFCRNCGQKVDVEISSNSVDNITEGIASVEQLQKNKETGNKKGCGCGCLLVILCLLFLLFGSCGKDKDVETSVVEQKHTQEVKNLDKEKAPQVQQEEKKIVEEPKRVESTLPSTSVAKNSAVSPQPKNRVSATYVGNIKTRKYHRESCSSVNRMRASNRTYFDSSSSARSAGYTPCNICRP